MDDLLASCIEPSEKNLTCNKKPKFFMLSDQSKIEAIATNEITVDEKLYKGELILNCVRFLVSSMIFCRSFDL